MLLYYYAMTPSCHDTMRQCKLKQVEVCHRQKKGSWLGTFIASSGNVVWCTLDGVLWTCTKGQGRSQGTQLAGIKARSCSGLPTLKGSNPSTTTWRSMVVCKSRRLATNKQAGYLLGHRIRNDVDGQHSGPFLMEVSVGTHDELDWVEPPRGQRDPCRHQAKMFA